MAATETDLETTPAQDAKQTLQIDVQVDKTATCVRHVVVTIPRGEVERYYREAFNDVAPKAELPGFRAGKAPRKLVESRFREQVAEQVKSSLVMDSLQQITEGDHFSAISEPDFDYKAIVLPDEGDFKYEFSIEVRPDFETPKWEGLQLERPDFELTDEHVDEHLSRTLRRYMPGEAVDGPAELGDMVTLNATFKFEGKQCSEFEQETVTLTKTLNLGDAIIDNFGELISGQREGDRVSTTVTLSQDAAVEAMRGKEVEVEFEIAEVKRIEIDEIGPQMLDRLGFDNVDELRGFVRDELNRQFEYHRQQALRKQIVEQLTRDANWDMPESLVRRQTNRELQRMLLELQRSGFSQQQINSHLNVARFNARESTIAALREHFVLEKIAEDLKLEPTAEEYDKEIALIAEQNDTSPRRIRARLEKSGQMDAIRNQIIERHVIERIVAAGQVSDKAETNFLASDPESTDIDFAIAGDYSDIPDAKHDNDTPAPGALKLPEKEKEQADS